MEYLHETEINGLLKVAFEHNQEHHLALLLMYATGTRVTRLSRCAAWLRRDARLISSPLGPRICQSELRTNCQFQLRGVAISCLLRRISREDVGRRTIQ